MLVLLALTLISVSFAGSPAEKSQPPRATADLFLAFQSGLGNTVRRKVLRKWLQPLLAPSSRIQTSYRIFSDAPLPDAERVENVVLPAGIHYQPAEWRSFLTRRLLFELSWADRHYNFRWLVRMDDDVFLCVPNFVSMLLEDLPRSGSHIVFGGSNIPEDKECEEAQKHPGRELQPIMCWLEYGFLELDECMLLFSSEFVVAMLAKVASAAACEPWNRELPLDYMRRLFVGDDSELEENLELGAPNTTSKGQRCSPNPWPPADTLGMHIGTHSLETAWGRTKFTGRWMNERESDALDATCIENDLIWIHNQDRKTSFQFAAERLKRAQEKEEGKDNEEEEEQQNEEEEEKGEDNEEEEEQHEEENLFEELDTNNDLKLSKEEITVYFEKQGQTLPDGLMGEEDKDSDGFISWEEFGGPKGEEKSLEL